MKPIHKRGSLTVSGFGLMALLICLAMNFLSEHADAAPQSKLEGVANIVSRNFSKEFRAIKGNNKKIDDEISRIASHLNQIKQEVKKSKGCKEINCSELHDAFKLGEELWNLSMDTRVMAAQREKLWSEMVIAKQKDVRTQKRFAAIAGRGLAISGILTEIGKTAASAAIALAMADIKSAASKTVSKLNTRAFKKKLIQKLEEKSLLNMVIVKGVVGKITNAVTPKMPVIENNLTTTGITTAADIYRSFAIGVSTDAIESIASGAPLNFKGATIGTLVSYAVDAAIEKVVSFGTQAAQKNMDIIDENIRNALEAEKDWIKSAATIHASLLFSRIITKKIEKSSSALAALVSECNYSNKQSGCQRKYKQAAQAAKKQQDKKMAEIDAKIEATNAKTKELAGKLETNVGEIKSVYSEIDRLIARQAELHKLISNKNWYSENYPNGGHEDKYNQLKQKIGEYETPEEIARQIKEQQHKRRELFSENSNLKYEIQKRNNQFTFVEVDRQKIKTEYELALIKAQSEYEGCVNQHQNVSTTYRDRNKSGIDEIHVYDKLIGMQAKLISALKTAKIKEKRLDSEDCKEMISVIISGKIRSSDGDALSDATASVEIESKQYSGTSDSGGSYLINIPKSIQVPGTIFVMASKQGFNTDTKTINQKDFDKADFSLSKASKYVVQIDTNVHHLGDSDYSGGYNSQFQKANADGVSYSTSFELSQEQILPNILAAKITLISKGVEKNSLSPVAINKQKVGYLSLSNSDGSNKDDEISFDACILKEGKNAINISTPNNGGADDFEFTNIQLVLTPAGKIKDVDNKQLAKISSVTVTDQSFQKHISSINKDGQFWIKAKGKSQCANAKGLAKAVVYPKGTVEDEQTSILLMETSPNSSDFRSIESVSVAKLGAKEGQTIVIKSGMRGVNVKVNDPNAEKLKELKKKLAIVRQASKELYQSKVRWANLASYIDEQRAKGEDVSALMRNLRRMTDEQTTARARYVALKNKHGSIKSLEAEIKKLDPSYVPQPTSEKKPVKPGSSSSPVDGQANGSTASATGSSKAEKTKSPTSGAEGGTSSTPASGSKTPATSAKTQPKAKSAAVKPERWDAYKLQVRARNSGLPNIDVVKIAFNLTSTRAEMRIRHYPVSLMRDENSGITLWKVNWSGGEIIDQQSSNNEKGMKLLTAKAHKLRQGSVGKSAVDGLIKQQLGPRARPLN